MTGGRASKLVAVVVPLSTRPALEPDEKISLRHLETFLGGYDRFLLAPGSHPLGLPGFRVKRFADRFFGSAAAHSRLLLSSLFYRAFREYRFILIYHLDSLVFSDQLTEWCRAGYDYIGAPWIVHEDAPYVDDPLYANKVGNGGFSLRKVDSLLKVIHSSVNCVPVEALWKKRFASKPRLARCVSGPWKILKRMGYHNSARWEMSRFQFNEERFWANRASHYCPDFRIAPVETALRFAFEAVPRYCYEKNNFSLPFGCHAWRNNDPQFWESHLLRD